MIASIRHLPGLAIPVTSDPLGRLIEVIMRADEDSDVSALVNEARGAVIAGDSEFAVWVSKMAGALDNLSMERGMVGVLKEQRELALSDFLNVLGKTGEQRLELTGANRSHTGHSSTCPL